jgi:NitT/TauT family transport system substrate-binding protein
MSMRLAVVFIALPLLAASASAQQPAKIVIGAVPSLPSASTYLAADKGYFREAGIEVEIENLGSAADAMAMLASNRMQIVEGGYSAGYWNALAQGMPVTMAYERGSSPLNHKVVIAPDMADKIKSIADLKGKTVAVNAPGSLGFYELYKVLGSAGLTIKDINVKYLPFTQMPIALGNHAVDAAEDIPPFSTVAIEQGLVVVLADNETIVKPYPVSSVAYQINTDWAAKNQDVARKFFIAVGRGTRDYCQAYHNGPNRQDVIDVLMAHKVMSDRALLERMPWQGRDPNGRLNPATALDIQDVFFTQGLINKKFNIERLIDTRYADEVASALGPFELVNKASTLAGCR